MDLPYRLIEPKTPEYRQFIATAITTGDKAALSALRGNTGKTIRLVHGWFHYGLMVSSYQAAEYEPDEVVIYTPEASNAMVRALKKLDELK